MRELRMCTAPAPTSNEGSGKQKPLRAKSPKVWTMPDLSKPAMQLSDFSVAHQNGWSLLMVVKPKSPLNWNPEKPCVSAGARLRGAKMVPSSDESERKAWLS